MEYFKVQKPLIENFLKSYFLERDKAFESTGNAEIDLNGRLLNFALRGKMIRGGLVLLSHTLFKGSNAGDALKAAGAMEMIQSGFLIHDDIMDRDTLRRGNESVFYQYKTLGDGLGLGDSYHFGESLGICAGDAAYFTAFEILSGLECDQGTSQKIFKLFTREISNVPPAQMLDVYFGYLNENPGEEAVMMLYKYKTGRYSFSLPLLAGAMLAGREGPLLDLLEKIGESLGFIFQLKDDEIGLFGSEEDTGKPAGSDIKENKKSLYHYYLFQRADSSARERLSGIFGSPEITPAGLEYVKNLALKLGIPKTIENKISVFRNETEGLLGSITGADPDYITIMHELLDYSVRRKK